MRATEQEILAGRQLCDALLHFVMAVEDAWMERSREMWMREQERMYKPIQPKQPSERDRLLVTTREAAQMLGVSGRTIWKLTAPRGPIPQVRVGCSVRYAVEDLKAAAEQMKVKS